ncbi:hypothetical protein CC85DRAFT_20128, partial [Cutaneotrichosporon oleaginosum]
MAAAHLSHHPRPASPPISVLSRPPILPIRSTTAASSSSSSSSASSSSSFASGQSLSSVLSIPTDTIIDGQSSYSSSSAATTTKRNSRGAPPSAFQRSRYSAPAPPLFDGQDTRKSVLDILKSIDNEWEILDPTAVIPTDLNSSPKRSRRSKGERVSAMSTADPSRQGAQKKPSLFRRLTQSSSSQSSAPPPPVAPPAAPPQLPRLSTLLSDSSAPLASVTKGGPVGGVGGVGGGGAYPSNPGKPTPTTTITTTTTTTGGLTSGTLFGDSPPHTPVSYNYNNTHSLPPGAAAPTPSSSNMSPPNGLDAQRSGFRVQSRAQGE